MRIIKRTRDYLALVRPHTSDALRFNPASLHRSFAVLFREIEHFYVSLVGKHVDNTTSERLGNVHGRQELLVLVEASLSQLASSAESIARDAKLAPLVQNFAEALDFLLMFAGDAARTLDRDRAQFVFDLSSDRGEMMGGIRALYLAPDQALTADEKALLLRLTSLFERVVWMLQRYADLLLKNVDAIG
jgi:phosphate:Na+ symporter